MYLNPVAFVYEEAIARYSLWDQVASKYIWCRWNWWCCRHLLSILQIIGIVKILPAYSMMICLQCKLTIVISLYILFIYLKFWNSTPIFSISIRVFPKIGVFTPKWMVKIMENPIKMEDLGVCPLFLEGHPYNLWFRFWAAIPQQRLERVNQRQKSPRGTMPVRIVKKDDLRTEQHVRHFSGILLTEMSQKIWNTWNGHRNVCFW